MLGTSDNILSEILTKTTEYDPTTNPGLMHFLHAKSCFIVLDPASKFEDVVYKFCAGSVAELRIKTLLSCIGSVDVMFHALHDIALPPQDQYLPSHRLDIMSPLLNLHKMVSLPDYPGYVLLYNGGFLTWNIHTKSYDVAIPEETSEALSNLSRRGTHGIARGPAVHVYAPESRMRHMINGRCFITDFGYNYVRCIRCPCWPSDALDFIDRMKPSGWPSASLIDDVRRAGCDVVPVAHPDCRPHNTEQWRLSFSRAELILVRSWTKVQQIVYHLLRYFIKHTVEQDNEIISNYHLKTIMLWKCEEEDGTFWNESQLIAIVSRLISCLVQHLHSQRLPHYFIATCNLFDSRKIRNNRTECERLMSKLNLFTAVETLVHWFLENYIVAAYETIPQPQRYRYMQGYRYITDLVKRPVNRDRRKQLEDIRKTFLGLYSYAKYFRNKHDFNIGVNIIMNEFLPRDLMYNADIFETYLQALPQVDAMLDRFYRGFWYLLLAEQLPKLQSLGICSQLVNFTLKLMGVPNISDYAQLFDGFQDESPEFYFSNAMSLLRIQNTAIIEAGLLLILAKACLVKSLESYGEQNMFYNATTAYLATMLYSENQYQLTFDFCASITSKITKQRIGDCCKVELQLLPYCDDISIASGFSLLYEYITRKTSQQAYDYHRSSGSLTPTLLTYFVGAKALMRCPSDTTFAEILRLVKLYYGFLTKSFSKASLSTCDICLYGFMLTDLRKLELCSSVSERHSLGELDPAKRTIIYTRRGLSGIISLHRSFLYMYTTTVAAKCPSFERLINRNDMIKMFVELSLIQLPNAYRALNHYRQKEYDSVLKICCENLNAQSYPGVVCSRPFNLLLDDDLAKIIDRRSASSVTEVSYGFLKLYLKLRCLLNLHRPGSDVARGLIELTINHKYLIAMLGRDCVEVDILRFTVQMVRTFRTDLIIHGEERVSVKENGSYTTFFVDPECSERIITTTVADVPYSEGESR